jgi:hypothetical protein
MFPRESYRTALTTWVPPKALQHLLGRAGSMKSREETLFSPMSLAVDRI